MENWPLRKSFSDALSLGRSLSKLCRDQTLAQSYVNHIREFISDLEKNGSYSNVLEKRAHAIAYLKDDTMALLISSNCSQYLFGLNEARKLDRNDIDQQRAYEQEVFLRYKQLLRTLDASGLLNDDF